MSELNTCSHCQSIIDETDNYCRQCGRSLKPGHNFWFSHTGIILLALVAGPFALPCVWMSKRIGPAAKWIYTAVLLLITYFFVLFCYKMFLVVQDAVSLFTQGF